MPDTAMSPPLAEAEGPPCPGTPQPLRSLFAEAAHKYPGNTAVAALHQQPMHEVPFLSSGVNASLAWTYEQLDRAADHLTTAFYNRGLRRGMRVAVFLFNSAEWALLFWSSLKLGAIFVPLDARSVSRQGEVQHYMEVVKPAVLVVEDSSAAESLQRNNALDLDESVLKFVAHSDGPFPEGWTPLHNFIGEALTLKTRDEEIKGTRDEEMQDLILIVFTSGTSGLPKACPHTNMTLWTSYQAEAALRPFGPEDSVVQHLPPSHSFVCIDMVQCWADGASIVYPAKGFEAKATLDAIENMQCTYMSALPSLYLALIMHPSFAPKRVKSLHQVCFGGTIIALDTLTAAADPAQLGKARLGAGFGMSEVLPVFGATPDSPWKAQNGCLGFDTLQPGAKVRICEPGSREPLERGKVGELHIGGSGVISGYMYGDNMVFYDDDMDHWIASGDQARMEKDGTLYIMGRFKDIIIRGGENLSPGLIEACLDGAGVTAQVVGIPDSVAGEVPVAVIQSQKQGPVSMEEMKVLIEASLGTQNTPVAYLTLRDLEMDALPMTASGKVRKDRLKELVVKHLLAKVSATATEAHIAISTVDGHEQLLVQVFAELIGQPAATISLDNPIATLTDSINILRFQAKVKKLTKRNITTEDVLGTASIRTLAKDLDRLPMSDEGIYSTNSREGPPTTADMVHAQGESSQTLRTRLVIDLLLSRFGMTWPDVEDVFPIPDLSSRIFESTRTKAFSLRMCLVARSARRSRLRMALEATLQQWAMFRALAIKLDQQALFVTVRGGVKWFETVITEGSDLETPQDLCSLTLPSAEKNNVLPRNGSPLARFVTAHVKSTGTAGLVILVHHSPHDAISLQAFMRDLQHNLTSSHPAIETRTSYKTFADMYYQYSISLPAQIAAAFHVNRLRGISSLRDSCWPRQRCVGAHIGDDEGYTVPLPPDPALSSHRTQIDNDGGNAGLVGIQKLAPLKDLGELLSRHKISAPVLFKAACALLNSHLASSSEVLFQNTQAGRQWPFMDPSLATYLPNPITIAGNTLASVVNRIQIHPHETVGSFVSRLMEEQQLLTAHAHCPTASITAQLNAGDAAAFWAAKRQLRNWNPSLADVANRGSDELVGVQLTGYTEVMLEWHCGMLGTGEASVLARWDGCQAGKAEVQGWADKFMEALLWVASLENWEMEVERLRL